MHDKLTGLVVLHQKAGLLQDHDQRFANYGPDDWYRAAHDLLVRGKRDLGRRPDHHFLSDLASLGALFVSAIDVDERARQVRDPARGPTEPNARLLQQCAENPIHMAQFSVQETVGEWCGAILSHLELEQKRDGKLSPAPENAFRLLHMTLTTMKLLVLEDIRDRTIPETPMDSISRALKQAEITAWDIGDETKAPYRQTTPEIRAARDLAAA